VRVFREFGGTVVDRKTFPNFVVVETRYFAGENLPQHSHERAFISITLTGSYSETYASETYDCTVGQTIFHVSGESHWNRFGDRGADLLNLIIDPHLLDEIQQLGLHPEIRSTCASQYCLQLATKLRHEAFFLDDQVSGLVIAGLGMELCGEVFRSRTTDLVRNSDWLNKVDGILRDRFCEPVTLAELAATVHVHPVHLARAFRKRFGVCVGEQIRKLRIEAACRELRHSRLPIADVAARTGFSDQSHLSRTLKRHTGMSPHEFRFVRRRNLPGGSITI
jgi:AraC family transcriptional regulator